MSMRIGIFGGTFDPVHLGHLILAEQCREQGRLDRVWFVPAARPPHKQDQPLSPFAQRVEMLSLAIAGHPAFHINDMEKDRPGFSYTVDTLAHLRRTDPDTDFHLLIGSDCLPDLPSWRDPSRIVEQAGILVVERPSAPVWSPEQLRAELRLPAEIPLRFQAIHSPLVAISSRDLRRKSALGQSIRYLVPRAVECFIETHRLYTV